MLEAIGVRADLEVGRDLVFEAGLSFAGAGVEIVEDVLDFGAQVNGAEVHDGLAAFEARDGEQVFNEEGEAVGVFFDGAKELAGDFGIVFGAFEQGFDEAFDEGKRGAEFVADVGDEFAAGVFELFEAGEVVEDEDVTGGWRKG